MNRLTRSFHFLLPAVFGAVLFAQPPTNVSVAPSSGSGTTQTFAFTASSVDGYSYLTWMQIIFNYDTVSPGSCYFYFAPSANVIYLNSDDGGATGGNPWVGSGNLQSSGTLQNSQCSLALASSSFSGSGNNLTLNLALTFKTGLPGPQNVYMMVGDAAGQVSNWQQMGTWTTTAVYSQSVSAGPVASGSGFSQTFSYVASTPNGGAYVVQMDALFTATFSGAGACFVQYMPKYGAIYLWNDAATSASMGVLGSGTLSNSQCTLNLASSSAVPSGSGLTLNLALTFNSSFAGAQNNYVWYRDRASNTGWVQVGTWTVPPPPPADFTVSLAPNTATALAGGTATYTVTIGAVSGFAGTAAFAASGLPSGATATFSPASVSGSGTTTLTIATAAGIAGNFSFTVVATSGALIHTASALVSVQDFTWTISPTSQMVSNGGTGTYNGVVSPVNGFNQQLFWRQPTACSGYATALFGGGPITLNGSSNFTLGPINLGYLQTQAWGCDNVCVANAAASLIHCAQATVGINQAPDFSIAVSAAQTVTPPANPNYTVTVTPAGGLIGTLTLAISGLPPGATYVVNPTAPTVSGSPSYSTLALSVPAGVPPGTYTIAIVATITGVSGSSSHTATTSLVAAGPSQVIMTSPSGLSLLVDGVPCASPYAYSWAPGTTHTISTTVTQAGTAGTQYVFSNWSDGGSVSHTITAGSTPVAYTANFTTQYYVTTSASPPSAGTIAPSSGWYNSGTLLTVTATPASGYQFSNFSGSLTGPYPSGYFSVEGSGTIAANFAVQGTTPLPDLSDMAMLSMFVERHQWLLSQPGYSTSGLYNIPSGDLATVNSVVASAKSQLDQLASQAPSYVNQGDQYVSVRNGILQGIRTELQSLSSWNVLDAYMRSANLSAQPLTADSGSTAQSSCPQGYTCDYLSSLISFYNGGLGGRIDTWVEGPDAPKFCVGETQFKPLFNNVPFGNPSADSQCNGKHSYVGFTTKDPQAGTYTVQAYQNTSGDGITEPPFTNFIQSGAPGGDWEFIPSNGYDMLTAQVGLALQVAGAQMDPSGQNAVVTSCSAPIILTAVLTPALPSGNTEPPITWTGGSAVDNMHRSVACAVGNTTVTAKIGANLTASVTVEVDAPAVIQSIDATSIAIGAQNVPITILGTGFGSSQGTVNLPQGFTNGGQVWSDGQIVVTVSVGNTATPGPNVMSVTTAHGGQSNNATIIVTVPITVAIQVPDAFVSMAGNGLVLLGGPGGLTTTAITANGNPAGGTVVWTPGPRLQINGINSLNASVSGTAASTSAGDTYVSVQYTVNGQSATASVPFTVINPTTLTAVNYPGGTTNNATVPYNNGTYVGYITTMIYYLFDQFSPPNPIALPAITNSELLTTRSNPLQASFDPPDGQAKVGSSDANGQMPDSLNVSLPIAEYPGGIPQNFTASRSQTWTVNGFGFAPDQVQSYSSTSATVQTQTLNRQ